jgi:hypothetical protein
MAEKEVEHVEAIAVTGDALEQIERASIDIQITTAKRYPRSMDQFRSRALAMVTIDAETAASCIYHRPVGKEGGSMKYAEGESVRLAEIVASSFSNIRVAGRITEMNPRYVKAQGVAHDLETNTAYTAEVVESTVGRSGVPFSERMRVVVAKSAQSKAIRDAIFRVIPKSLCKSLVIAAKNVAKGDEKTFAERRKAVVEWVKTLNIDAKRVWGAIGIKGPSDIEVNQLILLHGLKTAIEDGDCTIDETFPKPEAEQKAGSTTERILGKKESEAPPPEKPPKRKRRTKAQIEADKKAEEEAKAKAEAPTTPPLEDPTEAEEQQDPPDGATEEEDLPQMKWQCQRCMRQLSEKKDGKCPHCMSDKIQEI